MDINAVAKRAGVSIATVSRTINHVPTVDPHLAKRVWEAINELNYFPNTQARGLVSGRSRLLGLIVSEITNPFFPELIQGFEEVAVESGYEILVSSTNYDPNRMSLCIRRMLERNAEGVAIMTFGIEEPLLDQLAPASAFSRLTIVMAYGRGCSIWPPSGIAKLPSSPGPPGCTQRNPDCLHSPPRSMNAAFRLTRRGS
jgi:DNA-binding LacI/PurR family transcriptional regulator